MASPKNYTEAVKWFRESADHGTAAAQFNLGRMYEGGHGVGRNFVEAAKWYQKAADQGDAAAQFNLGALYFKGLGVPQDYVETHKWLKIAATRFRESAPDGRQRAEKNLKVVAAKMTRLQIWQAQKLASEWKPPTR